MTFQLASRAGGITGIRKPGIASGLKSLGPVNSSLTILIKYLFRIFLLTRLGDKSEKKEKKPRKIWGKSQKNLMMVQMVMIIRNGD